MPREYTKRTDVVSLVDMPTEAVLSDSFEDGFHWFQTGTDPEIYITVERSLSLGRSLFVGTKIATPAATDYAGVFKESIKSCLRKQKLIGNFKFGSVIRGKLIIQWLIGAGKNDTHDRRFEIVIDFALNKIYILDKTLGVVEIEPALTAISTFTWNYIELTVDVISERYLCLIIAGEKYGLCAYKGADHAITVPGGSRTTITQKNTDINRTWFYLDNFLIAGEA